MRNQSDQAGWEQDRPTALHEGYTDLMSGQIASVVTYLEMRQSPTGLRPRDSRDLTLRRVEKPDLNWYRDLFRSIGANWLWFSRLKMDDSQLRSILWDPLVLVYALEHEGKESGLLELDCRQPPEIEITFLGVTEELIGKGAGRFLLEQALTIGWSRKPERITVHTCSLDHPNALFFYLRAGFAAYKRAIEVSEDPRLTGVLPRSVAPNVPIIV